MSQLDDVVKYGSLYKIKTNHPQVSGDWYWEIHYFKTRADLIDSAQYTSNNNTYYKLTLDTRYHTVNGHRFGQTSGITLTASDLTWEVPSGGYIASLGADGPGTGEIGLNPVLQLLDSGIKAAFDNIPSGVLTTSNYGTTLNSVYQAKFTDGSATIASVSNNIVTIKAGVKQTSGAIGNSSGSDITLAKVAKTGAFSDLSGTEYLVSTDTTLTLNKIIVGYGERGIQASSYTIDDLKTIAEGKTKSYVDWLDQGKIYFGNTEITSGVISDVSGKVALTITDSTNDFNFKIGNTTYTYVYIIDEEFTIKYSLKVSDLKIGDVVLIGNTNVPDYWWTGSKFSKLETTKVDLTPYAKKASPTFTGTVTLPTSVKIGSYTTTGLVKYTNGTLSIDTNSYLTAHPTITTNTDTTDTGTLSHSGTFTAVTSVTRDSNGHVTKINTKTYTLPASGNSDQKTSSADTNSKIFLVGATSQSSSGQTTYSHDQVYVGTDHCLYSNSVRVRNIYVASSEPSNTVVGDIWIDTTNAS